MFPSCYPKSPIKHADLHDDRGQGNPRVFFPVPLLLPANTLTRSEGFGYPSRHIRVRKNIKGIIPHMYCCGPGLTSPCPRELCVISTGQTSTSTTRAGPTWSRIAQMHAQVREHGILYEYSSVGTPGT